MREFSWKYFTLTGNIEAYLLYREARPEDAARPDDPDEPSVDSTVDVG